MAVYERDAFTCQACGWRPEAIPEDYDGAFTLGFWPHRTEERALHVDHRVPRRAGGSSDLGNLQTLCGSCNCSKSGRQ